MVRLCPKIRFFGTGAAQRKKKWKKVVFGGLSLWTLGPAEPKRMEKKSVYFDKLCINSGVLRVARGGPPLAVRPKTFSPDHIDLAEIKKPTGLSNKTSTP